MHSKIFWILKYFFHNEIFGIFLAVSRTRIIKATRQQTTILRADDEALPTQIGEAAARGAKMGEGIGTDGPPDYDLTRRVSGKAHHPHLGEKPFSSRVGVRASSDDGRGEWGGGGGGSGRRWSGGGRPWSYTHSDFRILGKLGTGRCSEVLHVVHMSTGIEMALKCYFKSQFDEFSLHQIKEEIAIQSSLSHPAITNLYDWFEDMLGNVYIMLELARSGDAFNLVHSTSNTPDGSGPSESHICRSVIHPLVTAVAHLHAKGFMHRDIKSENLLITDDQQSVKLADFGFAVSFREHRPTTKLGTLEYMVGQCSPLCSGTLHKLLLLEYVYVVLVVTQINPSQSLNLQASPCAATIRRRRSCDATANPARHQVTVLKLTVGPSACSCTSASWAGRHTKPARWAGCSN